MELVKLLPVHRYSVDSGPSGILGSDGKQNTVAGGRGLSFVALSISSHEQTQ